MSECCKRACLERKGQRTAEAIFDRLYWGKEECSECGAIFKGLKN